MNVSSLLCVRVFLLIVMLLLLLAWFHGSYEVWGDRGSLSQRLAASRLLSS